MVRCIEVQRNSRYLVTNLVVAAYFKTDPEQLLEPVSRLDSVTNKHTRWFC